MAFVPLIEYASGEFAGFEFAREDGTRPVATDFQSAGEAAVQLQAEAISFSAFSVQTNTAISFHAQTAINSRLVGAAESLTAFDGGLASLSMLLGSSKAEVDFKSGVKLYAAFFVDSGTEVSFNTFDGHVFDFSGKSTVLFDSGTRSNTSTVIAETSESKFYTQMYVNSGYLIQGQGLVVFSNNALVDANLSSVGSALPIFRGMRLASARMESLGSGLFLIRAQAIGLARIQATGTSDFSAVSQVWGNVTLVSAAQAAAQFQGSITLYSQLEGQSEATVTLYAGSPVYTSLPPAYDVVWRPCESRKAYWK